MPLPVHFGDAKILLPVEIFLGILYVNLPCPMSKHSKSINIFFNFFFNFY